MFNPDTIKYFKSRYAYELLKVRVDESDLYRVLRDILVGYPQEFFMVAAREWPQDPYVIAEKARFLAELGEEHFLPSKAEVAKVLWQKANGRYTENKDAVNLLKLYAEVQDMVPRTGKLTDKLEKVLPGVTIVASKFDEDL